MTTPQAQQTNTPPMPPALYAVAKKSFPGANDQQILQTWGTIVSQMSAQGGNATDPQNQMIIAKLLSHPDMQKIQKGQPAPQEQQTAHMAEGGDVTDEPVPDNIKNPMANTASPASIVSPQASLNQFSPDAVNAANSAYTQQANTIRNQRAAGNIISGFGGDSGAASVRNAETNAQIAQAKDQTVGNQEKLQAQATAGLAAAQAVQTMNMNAGKYGPELFKLGLANESTGIENKTKQIALDQTTKLSDAGTPESGAARDIARQHFIDMGHPELANSIHDNMNGLQATATAKAADDNFKTNNEAITAKATELQAKTAAMTANQAASITAAGAGVEPPPGVLKTQPLTPHLAGAPAQGDGTTTTPAPEAGQPGTLGNTGLIFQPPGFTNPAATGAATTGVGRQDQLSSGISMYKASGLDATIQDIKGRLQKSGFGTSNATMNKVLADLGNVDIGDLRRKLATAYEGKVRSDAAISGGVISTNIVQEAEKAANDLLTQNPQVVLKTLNDWDRNNKIQTKMLGEMNNYAKSHQGALTGYIPGSSSSGNKKYNPATGSIE